MKKNEFKPIETVSDWSYIDKLDGQDITDGEKVEVQWPDGIILTTNLRFEKGSFTYNDMGHQYEGPDYKAYLMVLHHGATLRVNLRKTGIKLRRIK